MTDRIDDIRARLEAATPGPWDNWDGHVGQRRQAYGPVDQGGYPTEVEEFADIPETFADADLIAHAPDDLDYLLSALSRAHTALERVGEHLEANAEWMVENAVYRDVEEGMRAFVTSLRAILAVADS